MIFQNVSCGDVLKSHIKVKSCRDGRPLNDWAIIAFHSRSRAPCQRASNKMHHLPDRSGGTAEPVSFVEKLAASDAFASLYKEGMSLVEEAAAYLDGNGRSESKVLHRETGLAYSAESMRLTTRLMQIASWLLLQRAVNQGEMSRLQSASERHRVKLQQQDLASSPEMFRRLPARLQELSLDSLRLQARIILMDELIYTERADTALKVVETISPVQLQLARLQEAFKN